MSVKAETTSKAPVCHEETPENKHREGAVTPRMAFFWGVYPHPASEVPGAHLDTGRQELAFGSLLCQGLSLTTRP